MPVVRTELHPLAPSNLQNSLGLGAMDDAALSPNDSGYGSTSPGTEFGYSPPSASRRSFGGLSAVFKRGKRSQELFKLRATASDSPNLKSASPTLPIQGRHTNSSEPWTA